jgi:hypothetical protein
VNASLLPPAPLLAPEPASSAGGEESRASPDLRTQPLEQKIAGAAEELWRGYGRPKGRDVEIWLEAERQVLGTDPEISRLGGSTPAEALNQSSPPSTASPGGSPAGTAISPSPASSGPA